MRVRGKGEGGGKKERGGGGKADIECLKFYCIKNPYGREGGLFLLERTLSPPAPRPSFFFFSLWRRKERYMYVRIEITEIPFFSFSFFFKKKKTVLSCPLTSWGIRVLSHNLHKYMKMKPFYFFLS